jgi:hypothetical protein
MITNQIIRAYIENLFQPSTLGRVSIVSDLNLGEFLWIQSIDWLRYYQIIKECVAQSLIDLNNQLNYEVYTIVLGYSYDNSSFNRRMDRFARKYPIRFFLQQHPLLGDNNIEYWTDFFEKGLFFERETDTYYAQWWQVRLNINELDPHILLLKNTNIPTIAIATKIPSEYLSEIIFDNFLHPLIFDDTCRPWYSFNRNIYQYIIENHIFKFYITDIEDGQFMGYPGISVGVQGSTDLIKSLVNEDTVIAQQF